MSYHADRFFAAVSELAGHGHVKQRLIKAYEDNLTEIDEDDLPDAARQAFKDLRRRMQRVAPSNGEGHICASVRKMSVEEASECAVMLVALFAEVARVSECEHAALARESGERPGVPPFLVKTN
jgi:hypothetical protein